MIFASCSPPFSWFTPFRRLRMCASRDSGSSSTASRFQARGAAGDQQLGLLKQLGATVVRTYGEPPDAVLDQAQKLGLKVIVGFWLSTRAAASTMPIPPGPNAQLERLAAFVTRYKDHPALLMWGRRQRGGG